MWHRDACLCVGSGKSPDLFGERTKARLLLSTPRLSCAHMLAVSRKGTVIWTLLVAGPIAECASETDMSYSTRWWCGRRGGPHVTPRAQLPAAVPAVWLLAGGGIPEFQRGGLPGHPRHPPSETYLLSVVGFWISLAVLLLVRHVRRPHDSCRRCSPCRYSPTMPNPHMAPVSVGAEIDQGVSW